MGTFDWLYKTVPRKIEWQPRGSVRRVKLVPKVFDPDGDEGPLMWSGFCLENEFGNHLAFSSPDLKKLDIEIFNVAGVSYRKKALQHQDFRPGEVVMLKSEDDNKHDPLAISVWNRAGDLMVGYIPRDTNKQIRDILSRRPDAGAIVLAHTTEGKRRVGLKLIFGPLDDVLYT